MSKTTLAILKDTTDTLAVMLNKIDCETFQSSIRDMSAPQNKYLQIKYASICNVFSVCSSARTSSSHPTPDCSS